MMLIRWSRWCVAWRPAAGFSVVFLLAAGVVPAADFYVAPTGSDAAAGTQLAPFRTLAGARDAVRKIAGTETVTVHVADGVYYLPATLVFAPADSGTAAHPIRYEAEHRGRAVISGGQKLVLHWRPYRDGIFQASVPSGLAFDQLFINGQCQRMARYPNYDPQKITVPFNGSAADAFSPARAARWSKPAGGFIHALHLYRWGSCDYLITGKQPDGIVTFAGGWQNNRPMGMHPEFRMVENIFEELDAPGEWYHNMHTDTLYYQPAPGTDLDSAVVEVTRLSQLIAFQGADGEDVRNITLAGFVFRHAARTFMETREPLLRSDWTIYRGGAVLVTGAEDVQILNGDFDQLGGNAIFVSNHARRVLIRGCHIHDVGASGICFVGSPEAVRDPLFHYEQSPNFAGLDRTPGPKTDAYPAECTVEDCLIHGIGRVELQSAGVELAMARQITVRDTSIYDCSRAGINIGDGCWGGHVIERCDVFDTVLQTADHGSFNAWGRDRYWSANQRALSESAVRQNPRLPFLDAVAPIIIRNSRWRCDHGWDIDLDDGASHYEIYNNLLLHGGLKFREGYGRKAWNNILVNCGFHPHVWFADSASAFCTNIVMAAHAPIGQPPEWGQEVDWNCFTSEADREKFLAAGADAHSVVGDPKFMAPEKGDFRVRPDSPALKIGFHNFRMDQFGVKQPALRSIARTPDIPRVTGASVGSRVATPLVREYWLGAALHGIGGEEFSAFGVSREAGGVQLVTVPPGSLAASAGFKVDDLIQSVNAMKTKDVADFQAALVAVGDAPLHVGLVRNQQIQLLSFSGLPYVKVESGAADDFNLPAVTRQTGAMITANRQVNNESLTTLVDGRLARNYGPIFPNGISHGAYKLDLGQPQLVKAITSWSFNQNGNRGAQAFTLYGSRAETDPGWDLEDSTQFAPLVTLTVTNCAHTGFQSVSWRARPGATLGTFRWIVWQVRPVTQKQENTAFQELTVDRKP